MTTDFWREHRGLVVLVALGGSLGSLGRWAVAEGFDHSPGDVAWSTILVNVTGALLLGVLLGTVGPRAPRVRALLGTGLLGGWTTFSTAMLDAHGLLREPSGLLVAAAYLGGSVVAGLVAVWLGLRGGRRLAPRWTS